LATTVLPIVAIDLVSDPVAAGFVASFAEPKGNVTGLFLDQPELTGKWLGFIKEVAPNAKRIAVLWDTNTGEDQVRVRPTSSPPFVRG
jgi:putative ABC transport system substrate-binding protein